MVSGPLASGVTVLRVNLWGHLSGAFGLGEGARCTVRALAAAGVAVQWRDLPLNTHVNDQPVLADERQPAAIDLIHTNPNVLRQTEGLLERLDLTAPLRIGYWAWELEAFPLGWEAGFVGLDQLWCPSAFTAEALALRSPVPVSPLPHLIDWERADRLAAQRLAGLPRRGDRPLSVLFCFDFWSTVARKNPYGVIQAFQAAFPPGREARLVLKISSAAQFPQAMGTLREHCASDPRILLLDRHLTASEMDGLLLEADVLLSLHRAEGFGLTLAEAMAAGLPVIATGYSGNLAFMAPAEAELVPYTLVPIEATQGDYPRGCRWAEPDPEWAARALRRLADNPRAHAELAVAGRRGVQARLGRDQLAAVVRQRLGTLLLGAGRAELMRLLDPEHRLVVLG
ncbi:MAG: glycosyltransferase [Cyanobacteriota bacterium]